VNRGDHVRLVIYSYYRFAFFTCNEFRIVRMVAHDTPAVVDFVATKPCAPLFPANFLRQQQPLQ
jgi:hypothetical protein